MHQRTSNPKPHLLLQLTGLVRPLFFLSLGVPVAVAMGGGYAPSIDDTVDIHFATVSVAARSTVP